MVVNFGDDFDATYYRVRSVDSGLNILELAKFTVLLQKETDTLHSDTQIHELRCELRQVLVYCRGEGCAEHSGAGQVHRPPTEGDGHPPLRHTDSRAQV